MQYQPKYHSQQTQQSIPNSFLVRPMKLLLSATQIKTTIRPKVKIHSSLKCRTVHNLLNLNRQPFNKIAKPQQTAKKEPPRPQKDTRSSTSTCSRLETRLHSRLQAASYVVISTSESRTLTAHNQNMPLQVASLTKIMTFYTIMHICHQLQLHIQHQHKEISLASSKITGTTASLSLRQVYTVEQLLYGLMLPSGNDAAVALAEWAGLQIRRRDGRTKNGRAACVRSFVRLMNKLTQQLGLKHTQWHNPHGMSDRENKSTASDIARLCQGALQNPVFKKVVSTASYKCNAVTADGLPRQVQWRNTNKLLGSPGFMGIKTGATATAGFCMATAFEMADQIFITIILKTSKPSLRFKETRMVLGATLKNYGRLDALDTLTKSSL